MRLTIICFPFQFHHYFFFHLFWLFSIFLNFDVCSWIRSIDVANLIITSTIHMSFLACEKKQFIAKLSCLRSCSYTFYCSSSNWQFNAYYYTSIHLKNFYYLFFIVSLELLLLFWYAHCSVSQLEEYK